MFLTFGSFGFVWIFMWILSFKEIRITTEDDDFIIIPSKVKFYLKNLIASVASGKSNILKNRKHLIISKS